MGILQNQIDHTEYPKGLKAKTMPELWYIIEDCTAVLKANPDGKKAGYYMDEINYAGMEIAIRKGAN